MALRTHTPCWDNNAFKLVGFPIWLEVALGLKREASVPRQTKTPSTGSGATSGPRDASLGGTLWQLASVAHGW